MAERLIRSAEEGGRDRLDEDAFLSDVFSEVEASLYKKLTEQLQLDPTPVKDAMNWRSDCDPQNPIGKKEIQEYLDDLLISIFYPRKLQLLQPRLKGETQTAKYVVMDEAQAAETVKQDHYGDNIIILTDEG